MLNMFPWACLVLLLHGTTPSIICSIMSCQGSLVEMVLLPSAQSIPPGVPCTFIPFVVPPSKRMGLILIWYNSVQVWLRLVRHLWNVLILTRFSSREVQMLEDML